MNASLRIAAAVWMTAVFAALARAMQTAPVEQGGLTLTWPALCALALALVALTAVIVWTASRQRPGGATPATPVDPRTADRAGRREEIIAAGRVLSSSLDFLIVLNEAVVIARRLSPDSIVSILLYDPVGRSLAQPRWQDFKPTESLPEVLPVDSKGICGLAVLRRKPVIVPDVAAEPRYIATHAGVRSELAVPMLAGDEIIGVLDLQSVRPAAYDELDAESFGLLAEYAASALRNARHYKDTQRRFSESLIIDQILRHGLEGKSYSTICIEAVELLRRQFQTPSVVYYTIEPSGTTTRLYPDEFPNPSDPLDLSDPMTDEGFRKALEERHALLRTSLPPASPVCTIWTPIYAGGSVLGMLGVCQAGEFSLTQDDVLSFSAIAVQLAAAAEVAELTEQNRSARDRYEQLFNNAPDMYLLVSPQGTVLMCNRPGERMLRMTADQITGLKLASLFASPSEEEWRRQLRALTPEHPQLHATAQLRRADGSLIDVKVDARSEEGPRGEPMLFVMVEDISERRKTEQTLSYLANAMEHTADIVVITDATGAVEYVNQAFVNTTGFEREEILGQTTSLLLSGKHNDDFFRNMWKTIKAGKVYRGSVINRKKNGELYTQITTITPLSNASGAITHYISTGQDITKQRMVEEQLFQLQKMESIGNLVSGIAHDFNNILNNVMGFTYQLKKYARDEAKVIKYADTIENSAARGAEVAGQLLAVARKKVRETEVVDVGRMLSGLAAVARETFPKEITVIPEIAPDLYCVKGNKSELYQTFFNVCLNARDAMADGGTLIIAASNCSAGDDFDAALMPASPEPGSPCVKIRLVDTGGGIPPEILSKIFEPFYTTKSKGKGTGLGLYIAYTNIIAHGGLLLPESEVGKGTAFTILLPATTSELAGPEIAEELMQGNNEMILLVDDEATMRELGRELLEDNGYRVMLAEDGMQAIDIYRQHASEIDLVILDLVMPKKDGGQTFLELKRINDGIKVFFCTGYSSDHIITSLLEEYNLRAIQKPFHPEKFLVTVREVLAPPKQTS